MKTKLLILICISMAGLSLLAGGGQTGQPNQKNHIVTKKKEPLPDALNPFPKELQGGAIVHNKLYNNTEHVLYVRASKHNAFSIKPKQTGLLESTSGSSRFSISNHVGSVWVYTTLVFHGLPKGYTSWSRIANFPDRTATKMIVVNPDGALYLLPRKALGWDKKHFEEKQPKGYPVKPEKQPTPTSNPSEDKAVLSNEEKVNELNHIFESSNITNMSARYISKSSRKFEFLRDTIIVNIKHKLLPRDVKLLKDNNVECLSVMYISDLNLLRGLRLKYLHLALTDVSDLTPVKDMPLKALLTCSNSKLSNLTPIKEIKLEYLSLAFCNVTNVSPLASMPLKYLTVGSVADMSPLINCPLEELYFKPTKTIKGIEILRSKKTLKKINGMPADKFWKKYDAGELREQIKMRKNTSKPSETKAEE